ncbi:MAG TPA: hypothetical protein PLT82_12575 [Candidatus Hydrogenedens sp.]|nr:hypothetical protein [Candidatus Hydrogenedens sp.]HOL20995.1 hypothetical protein [Candidatus Hydrogenedens sp.]HPP59956.1 hypothetical protein [Candidatus Hydrogenedens sp.]
MTLSREEIYRIFTETVIIKKPRYGIIKGYHELPYICLGEALESRYNSLCVRGKIHVSPQFVIKPSYYKAKYSDLFGENAVDIEIAGRIFGFIGFPDKPVECKLEYLEVTHLEQNIDTALSHSLDELERKEDITTGVFITPDSRYYPISIERFITAILDDEFAF